MPYIQNITPPPNRSQNFHLYDFSGGLNNRSERINPNQASDLRNITFRDDLALEKRHGSKLIRDEVLGDEMVFVDTYEPYDDEAIRITATKTQVFANDVMIQDVNAQISGTTYNGKYIFTDGTRIYVYGKFPREDSTYEKVEGGVEDRYLTFRIFSPVSGFTPLGEEHTRGVTRYNYDLRQIRYEPCKWEVEDAFKGSNVIPHKVKFVVSHKGRLFVSGMDSDDDNVFISDLGNGYYFPSYLPIQLPPNSDRIRGLAVFDDSVIVGRRDDVHFINGETNRVEGAGDAFVLRKLNTHAGFANNTSASIAHNYLFYMGSDGNAYMLTNVTNNTQLLATHVLSETLDLFRAPLSFSREDIETACSYFFDDMWYVSIQDKVLVYSYRTRGWSVYDNLHIRSFSRDPHQLVWGNKDGQLVTFSEGYVDVGVPFRTYWVSKNFDMEQASTYKQFREFFVIAHTFDNYQSDVRVRFEIDFVDVKSEVVVTSKKSIWGVSRYGDRFITRDVNPSFPFVIGRRGRYMRFSFGVGYDVQDTVNHPMDLDMVSSKVDGSTLVYTSNTNEYYLYKDRSWVKMEEEDLNQPMKIYEINGEYETRGKR